MGEREERGSRDEIGGWVEGRRNNTADERKNRKRVIRSDFREKSGMIPEEKVTRGGRVGE